jgi:hypothetical protein
MRGPLGGLLWALQDGTRGTRDGRSEKTHMPAMDTALTGSASRAGVLERSRITARPGSNCSLVPPIGALCVR